MTTPAIDIHDLAYAVGRSSILRNIHLRVEEGQSVSIIGPNGAGKTTLLRCLMRVLHHTNGQFKIFGTPAQRLSQRQLGRLVSYVPQSDNSDASFSVREFVTMGRYPHHGFLSTRSATDDAAVAEALETTGVLELAERRISTLSGGERQRVSVAAAVAQTTRILLVDEPTAHLDYKHQVEMVGLLRQLHTKRHLTLISVTHHLNRSVFESDTVVALKAGSVLFSGPPQELLEDSRLEQIYGVPFQFLTDPQSGRTVVLPAGES